MNRSQTTNRSANPGGTSIQVEQISSKNNGNCMYFKKIVANIVNEYASRHLKKEINTINSNDIFKRIITPTIKSS